MGDTAKHILKEPVGVVKIVSVRADATSTEEVIRKQRTYVGKGLPWYDYTQT
jgi:hypothetical protein